MNDSNNNLPEVWMDVPVFNDYQVSNKGHLRKMTRRATAGKKTRMLYSVKHVALSATKVSSRLGWFIFPNGKKLFIGRDELLSLFKGIPTEPDVEEERKVLNWRSSSRSGRGKLLEPRAQATTKYRFEDLELNGRASAR